MGNLATGGTGKTPMVEYLLNLLKDDYRLATLSRGYKRKTKGFGIADDTTTALDIGDEPMQFHKKFPEVTVAVGEERLVAIPQLLDEVPETEAIILDDAFQHRTVKAGLNILLTDYQNLYTTDFFLPAGDLRDSRQSAERAQIIIVTKCKPGLQPDEKQSILKELNLAETQQLFFTKIEYTKAYHLFSGSAFDIGDDVTVLLICGIANPRPLQEYLTSHVQSYEMLRYPDHHIFSIDDLEEIKKQFGKIASGNKILVTTEKDGVRLKKFADILNDFPIYVLPIKHQFMFDEGRFFDRAVLDFVGSFNKPLVDA